MIKKLKIQTFDKLLTNQDFQIKLLVIQFKQLD